MPRREVLIVPGLSHGTNPIPAAVKMGKMVYSGSIAGVSEKTHQVPDDPEEQVVLAFANVRRVMTAAGGTPDHIARMDVYLKDMALRETVNREWVKMFPDASDRPVRHTTRIDPPANMVIQLQLIAVLD